MDMPESPPPQPANSSPITTAAADATEDPLSSPYVSLNSHCHELSTLQDLACRGAWRTILDKVARSRSLSLLSKPHEHLIYLTFNLLSLIKLRRYSDAQQELQTLDDDLDSKQYLFESYPDHYPNHKAGSMVPFALRWLHAHLPLTLGDRQLSSIAFTLSCILSAIKSCPKIVIQSAEISKNEDPLLVSQLGYVQMQYGDLMGQNGVLKRWKKMVVGSERRCEVEEFGE
ncbi:hypothetical protein DH2020_015379 [Rehmannia glutinosa]|uniref:Uncharacterized protein n=1 Tax=Rehmannia glutinosa TaxID=99300 RepID=A0ABR0WVS1_REHGL